jgi:hypothetical protein
VIVTSERFQSIRHVRLGISERQIQSIFRENDSLDNFLESHAVRSNTRKSKKRKRARGRGMAMRTGPTMLE